MPVFMISRYSGVEKNCIPRFGIPNSDGRVKPTGGNVDSVERDRIDLVEMAPQDVKAFSSVHIP